MSLRSGRTFLLFLAVLATACSNRLDGNGEDDTGPQDTDTGFVDPDNDEDGYTASQDCDDDDPNSYPGAPEICDGLDNDCDNVVPAEETDLDGNGVRECEEFCGSAPSASTTSTLSDCTYTPSPSGTQFEARIEWAMTHEVVDPATGTTIPAYDFADYPDFVNVWQAPMVGQITDDDFDGDVDEDDTPDIAVVMSDHIAGTGNESNGGVLRLISGDGRKVHASVHYTQYQDLGSFAPYKHSGLAVADIDNDGKFEIPLLLHKEGTTSCYPGAYEVRQTNGVVSLVLDKIHTNSAGTPVAYACAAHAPAIADVDNDGMPEVIYGRNWMHGDTFRHDAGGYFGKGWYGNGVTDDPKNALWGPDSYWNSGYHPVAYDLDDDGAIMEVIAGNSVYLGDGDDSARGAPPFSNWLYCVLADPDGSGGWVPARDGYPAVADILGDDGVPEIVVTGNEYVGVYDSEPVTRSVTDLHDFDADGNTTETLSVPVCEQWARIANDPDPASEPDLVGLPTHPYGCDETRQAFGGPPTVADFDNDGDLEIANAGACYYSVFHFDEDDGDTFKRFAIAATRDWSSASTGSTVFDFNGDGGAEVVFQDERALYVWQIDDTANKPWTRLRAVLEDENHKSWTIHEYPLVADMDGDGKAEILVPNSYNPQTGNDDKYGLYVLGAADDDWVSARETWNQHTYYVTNANDDLTIDYAAPNLHSFRLQAPGHFGDEAAANLFVTAEPPCQEGCGDITVYVQVANEGSYITAGTGVVVAVYGEYSNGTRDLLDQRNLSAPVQPGAVTQGIGFQISGWASYDKLVAVVDDPTLGGGAGGWGASRECDESDNEVEISLSGLCP